MQICAVISECRFKSKFLKVRLLIFFFQTILDYNIVSVISDLVIFFLEKEDKYSLEIVVNAPVYSVEISHVLGVQ